MKLLEKIKRSSFARYFIVGSSAFVLDMGTLFIFKQYFHWHPAVAVAVNQVIILSYIFFVNKYWSFNSTGGTGRQATRFLMLTGANYIIAISWIWFWVNILGIRYWIMNMDVGYLIGRTVNILLAIGWNYLIYKKWVYKHDSQDGTQTAPVVKP